MPFPSPPPGYVSRLTASPGFGAGAARVRVVSPGIAATATLLSVMASAALALALAPPRPATTAKSVAEAYAPAGSAAPVKIIGAAPRGENCAEQVWPYIEHRCLTRADKPRSGATAQSATESESGRAATAVAAPADNAPARSVAAEERAKPGEATADLPPPRPPPGAGDPARLPIPPGAVPIPPETWQRLSAQAAQAQSGERASPWMGEPRRRTGRRAHRSRRDPAWSSRPTFPF